jgi:hypothetical protein
MKMKDCPTLSEHVVEWLDKITGENFAYFTILHWMQKLLRGWFYWQ